ncbi:hypothetical protein SBC1_63770 (plasmid) [Caballeronia sp. SBC1]|nr:hypothetical protein SBC2_63490 [Caballeronia sp. SBC2]QIN66330.1 hypothetical protein SBC1_63770 [Caballeronia sp. SBC1]
MNHVAAHCSVHRVSLFEAPFAGLCAAHSMPPISRSPALIVRTLKIIAPTLRGIS